MGVERKQAEFTEFYQGTRDDCLRIVLVAVGDQALAEELVAEAFTRAWTAWRTVCRHPAPRAWVVRTALNAHVSWWRRRRREMPLDGHDLPVPADPASALDTVVVAALWRLPLRQRQVIALRLLLDLDTETTAQMLGISPGTVGVHLHRAIATLRGDIALTGDRSPPPAAALTQRKGITRQMEAQA
jgi:RNA polymerase sigma-70 factor (sigma-E family)